MTRLSKGIFRLTIAALILALIFPVIVPGIARANPGWYDTDWQYRKKITINSANVSDNLTNFPVLISLSDPDLITKALANGDDIVFTAADEVTRLSHEIEKFDSGSGNLTAWVKIPSLSAVADTEIYMYYKNPVASNSENVTDVWDTNYMMVQHLEETSGGFPDAITDSTSHANDGTDNNTPTFDATGQVNGAIGFDGVNEYIDVTHDSSIDFDTGDSFTAEVWVKITDKGQVGAANYQYFIDKRAAPWLT